MVAFRRCNNVGELLLGTGYFVYNLEGSSSSHHVILYDLVSLMSCIGLVSNDSLIHIHWHALCCVSFE